MLLAKVPSVGGPTIASMKERHHEIKRRLIAGDKQVDIAHSLGMTQAWLSIVVSSPPFQSELAKLRAEADTNAADIGKRLTALAPDAMGVLERAVRVKQDGISPIQQAGIARDVLDRTGYGKPVATPPSQVAVKVEILQFAAPIAKVIEPERVLSLEASMILDQ